MQVTYNSRRSTTTITLSWTETRQYLSSKVGGSIDQDMHRMVQQVIDDTRPELPPEKERTP